MRKNPAPVEEPSKAQFARSEPLASAVATLVSSERTTAWLGPALASQVVSSLTNAVISITVLVVYPPSQAGTASVVIASSFILNSFLRGAIVYGSTNSITASSSAAAGLLFGAVASSFLGLVVGVLFNPTLGLVVTAILPCIAAHEMARQALLVQNNWLAVGMDSYWLAANLLGLCVLASTGHLTNLTALISLWGAGAGIAVLSVLLGGSVRPLTVSVAPLKSKQGIENVLQGSVLSIVVMGAAVFLSLGAAAQIRACLVLLTPVRQLQASLQPALLGRLSRQRVIGPAVPHFRAGVALVGIAVLCGVGIWAVVKPQWFGENSPSVPVLLAMLALLLAQSLQMPSIAFLRVTGNISILMRFRVATCLIVCVVVAASPSTAVMVGGVAFVSSIGAAFLVYEIRRTRTRESGVIRLDLGCE